MGAIFKDDVGVQFLVDTGIVNATLATASKTEIRVRKPGGDDVTWTATVSGTSLSYTTSDGDLDESGTYKIAAYVEWTTSSTHWGETDTLEVYERFATIGPE